MSDALHYDPAAAPDKLVSRARAAEIEAVLDATKPDAPLRAGRLFEHYAIAFLALASRARPRTVIVSRTAYQRLDESGLLAFLRERYPDLTIERPKTVRGCHADMVILDEISEWEPDTIRSHGG